MSVSSPRSSKSRDKHPAEPKVVKGEANAEAAKVEAASVEGAKNKRDDYVSWGVLLVTVCLVITVSAQDFTVMQHYNSISHYAAALYNISVNGTYFIENTNIHEEVTTETAAATITDWALPPIVPAVQAVIMILPLMWIIETYGVRVVFGVLAGLPVVGAVLKLLAVYGWPTLAIYFGQTFINFSRIGLFPVVHRLCVAWFSTRSISLVCAIAFYGDLLGHLLGYAIPLLHFWSYGKDYLGYINTLSKLVIIYILTVMTAIFAIPAAFIKSEPKKPPSSAESLRRDMEKPNLSIQQSILAFLKRLLALYTNDFNLTMNTISFALAYGITMMIFHPIRLTLLFMVNEQNMDRNLPISLTVIICGYFGALVSGIILDRTRQHHYVAMSSFLGLFAFHILLLISNHSELNYLIFFANGGASFFFSCYVPAAIEYAAERSYPCLESTTTGILVAMGYLVTGIYSVCFGTHYTSVKDATLTGFASVAILSVGLLFTAGLENSSLRRHNAGQEEVL